MERVVESMCHFGVVLTQSECYNDATLRIAFKRGLLANFVL